MLTSVARAAPLLTALLLASGPVLAQGTVLDQGVLSIMRGTAEVGREEFTIRLGRPATGQPDGFTISGTATYSTERPQRVVVTVAELGPDSQMTLVTQEYRNGGTRKAAVGIGARRLTIRTQTPDGESAREHPRTGAVLVIDHSAFAHLALLGTMTPGPVTVVSPFEGERQTAQLTDHGNDRIRVKGVERALRHLSLGTGDNALHAWYDDRGHLVQVSIPARDIRAVREPS